MTAKKKDEPAAPGGPIPDHSRMDDEALTRRSEGFRRATQRKGMPQTYGTGKPGVGAEAVARANKIQPIEPAEPAE